MTYQEIIDNIKSLGFSDDAEMEEFMDSGVLPDSINRAITKINLEVPGSAPRNKIYEFDIEDGETEPLYIDMESIDPLFVDFAETAMLRTDAGEDIYRQYNDFDIVNESTVLMEPVAGEYRIQYKADPEKFTGTAEQLDATIPLARKVHHLVPLLAGYYVWLEDEPAKAAQYYNMYETEKNEIVDNSNSSKPRARILAGGI